MSVHSWYSKLSSSMTLPVGGGGNNEAAEGGGSDSLYILELFALNFKTISDGVGYALRLFFYNFRLRRFCGSQYKCGCSCRNSVVHPNSDANLFHFRARTEHAKSVVLVLEFGNKENTAICWSAVPVTNIVQMETDAVPILDNGQLIRQSLPLFAGACRPLLLADSLTQLQPHLQRLDAVLSMSLRLSSGIPPPFLPEFHFLPGPPLSRPFTDPSLAPFTAILDNLAIFYSVDSELSDAVILEVLSREYCYGLNKPLADTHQRLKVLERRLKVGVHNGLGFVEEPLCVMLQAAGTSSQGDSQRGRSFSLNRRDGVQGIGGSEFCARNSARLRNLIADPGISIVFLLEYLIGFRQNVTNILSETRLIRVGWAAWTPCPQGMFSLTDTVTLQLLGGPRSSPWDGLCLRDLSHSAGLINHSSSANALPGLPIQWPLTRAKIEIRFNFVPISEDSSNVRLLSVQSSVHQQTPLPRPDIPRPQSASAQQSLPLSPSPPPQNRRISAIAPSAEEGSDEQLLSPLSVNNEPSVPIRHRPLAVSAHETNQSSANAIEVEMPSARVSTFPRRLILQLSRYTIPQIAAQPKLIDPNAKRELRMELEKLDKLALNEVAIQFIAFKKMDYLHTLPSSSHQFFFTFQFFRFDPITTESLFADPESDPESPSVLWRNGGGGTKSSAGGPGLIVRFVVGADQTDGFADYLLRECVHIHVWESDSLFHLGTASFPIRFLLRQCSPALLVSLQVPVLQSGFPPSLGLNQLTGLLYLRISNSGRPAVSRLRQRTTMSSYSGKKAHSLRVAGGMSPLERFLAFQRIDLEQRSMRIFDEDSNKRMRQWAELRANEQGLSNAIAVGSTKFLFSEELAAYRALRREGKAMALLRAVLSSVTIRHGIEAIGGQVRHVRFQLRNPFPDDCICAMEVSDARLSPITSKEELRWLNSGANANRINSFHRNGDDAGDAVFRWEGDVWTMVLRAMERVEVTLRFDAETAEEGWSTDGDANVRAFFRRMPSGDPLAILELGVSIVRPFLSQHFRWFTEEARKLVRDVPMTRPNQARIISARTSDPSVLCQIQNRPSADAFQQLLRIECAVGELARVRDFLVFLYADPYHSVLCAVFRFSVHAFGRLHAETVQGQLVRLHLPLPPPSSGSADELIRLFCSAPAPSLCQIHLLPNASFTASSHSLAQMSIHLRPSQLGHLHLLINAVALSTSALLGQWLLSILVGQPNIVKVFEVTVPRSAAAVGSAIQKRIPLDNPLGIPRHLRLSSSDDRFLYLPAPSPPPIPPHSSIPFPLIIHLPTSSSVQQTLLFVEDAQTGAQEEAYAVKICRTE